MSVCILGRWTWKSCLNYNIGSHFPLPPQKKTTFICLYQRILIYMALRYTYKDTYLKHVSFLPFARIQCLEHLFSPSNNNRLTWRRSMCFCTSSPLPRCLDGSAHHVHCWQYHSLVGRNPAMSARSASSITCCTLDWCKHDQTFTNMTLKTNT
jgi:hypothetical protein